MKSINVHPALIAGLIVLFAVFGLKFQFEESQADQATRPVSTQNHSELKNSIATQRMEKSAGTQQLANESSTEGNNAPFAVPVLTAEEGKSLVERMNQEREEALKKGWVFYEDDFSYVQNASADIQQTRNWIYVRKEDQGASSWAKKQDNTFIIRSETPLEYDFVEPLFENTIYKYTLCSNVKGKGIIILSKKGENEVKEYLIDSKMFETVVYPLGDGTTLNTGIIPTITFQGNLEVESITLYQKKNNDQWTVCLGNIESISNVPDIKKANYPDCYYTAKFVVRDILDGQPTPKNIQLLIPAFLDNKLDPLCGIIKKGRWKVSIRPFSLSTQKEQEIEQVDEIESYLYTPYILVAASRCEIPEIVESAIPVLEGETYVSPFDNPVNPPLPDRFIDDSKHEIEKELAKVKKLIEQAEDEDIINKEFQIAWSEKQKDYESLNTKMIWAKEQNSFFALLKNYKFIDSSAQITEDNLNAIVELDHFFKSQGIQFIIQVVPDLYDIAALVLNPKFQKYGDQKSARVVKQLLERGVETQYFSDELVKNAFNYELLFLYPDDFHPHEGCMDIMTTLIARRINYYEELRLNDLDKSYFSTEIRKHSPGSVHWPQKVDIGSHEELSIMQYPFVLYKNMIIESNPASRVLIFGNSFIQYPMTKNTYISYLAPKIAHACSSRSMLGVSALTVLPSLFLSSTNSYLKNKLIAVLPISVKYLVDDKYSFSNITLLDQVLKNSGKSKYLSNIPLQQIAHSVFPPSFDFSFYHLPNYLPPRTSVVALSGDQPNLTFHIPDNSIAHSVRIAIQPLYDYGVTIVVNGESYRLPSRVEPKWEILEFDIKKNDETLSIKLDLDHCSSPDVKVLIGNISPFE